MSDELALSPSALSCFLQCKRKFFWQYIEKKKPEEQIFQPAREIGRIVHEALTAFYREVPRSKRNSEGLFKLFRKKLERLKLSLGESFPFWEEKVKAMAANYVEMHDLSREPLALEKWLYADFSDITLCGRIDRLDWEDNAFVIIEYKTGKAMADLNLQTSVYAYLVRASYKQPVKEVRYFYLASKEIIARPPELNQGLKQVYRLAKAIRQEKIFRANPGKLCHFCDYLSMCVAGKEFVQKEE